MIPVALNKGALEECRAIALALVDRVSKTANTAERENDDRDGLLRLGGRAGRHR